MSINAMYKAEQNFEITPMGNHVARVYSIIHIGTIEEQYMGEAKMMDKVRITFELPNATKEFKEGDGEKPFVISREYTNSMGEKANLRALIEGMLGVALHSQESASYDVTELMGKECLLNVIHKTSKLGRVYAHIQSASPLPQGLVAPEAINSPFILDFNENWNEESFEKLPDFVKDKIKTSDEYKKMKGIDETDGVPFSDVADEPAPEEPSIDYPTESSEVKAF